MKCINCKFWGDGNGHGVHYDAGAMGVCMQPQINGSHHPSYGACGGPVTMLYAGGDPALGQEIATRWNFGCNLFAARVK